MLLRSIVRFVAFAFGLYFASFALAPAASFDCTAIKLPLDRVICSDPELSDADNQLGIIYKTLLQSNTTVASNLQKNERIWLKSRSKFCSTGTNGHLVFSTACLLSRYSDHISYLYGLYTQPANTQQLHSLRFIYRPRSGAGVDSLIADSSGILYGSGIDDGPNGESSIFKLSPPLKGSSQWIYSPLFLFGRDIGEASISGLILDKAGNLYGTAGTWRRIIFELTPPATGRGAWVEKSLFTMQANGGPNRIIVDPEGNLFGTTSSWAPSADGVYSSSNGSVFELKRPAGGNVNWTGAILYVFQGSPDGAGPSDGLLRGSDGSLYGVTLAGGDGSGCVPQGPFGGQGCGTVFRLKPPTAINGNWDEEVLYSFGGSDDGANPNSPLIMDGKGALYGWTANGACPGGSAYQRQRSCGVVFKLTPTPGSRGSWTETVLHRFDGPPDGATGLDSAASLTLDDRGNLYGTTPSGGIREGLGAGIIFKLIRPANDESEWKETILYSFNEKIGGGAFPAADELIPLDGGYVGATLGGGNQLSFGTVYQIVP